MFFLTIFGCKIEVLKEHKMQLLSEEKRFRRPHTALLSSSKQGCQASACLGLILGSCQKAESGSGAGPRNLYVKQALKVKTIEVIQGPHFVKN